MAWRTHCAAGLSGLCGRRRSEDALDAVIMGGDFAGALLCDCNCKKPTACILCRPVSRVVKARCVLIRFAGFAEYLPDVKLLTDLHHEPKSLCQQALPITTLFSGHNARMISRQKRCAYRGGDTNWLASGPAPLGTLPPLAEGFGNPVGTLPASNGVVN